MNDQDEMFERATELPASMGCPSLMPRQLPGGFDGTEPGQENRNKITGCGVKWPDGFSLKCEKNGRTLVGVIERVGESLEDADYPYKYIATVYEGNDIVFCIDSCARGLSFMRQVLKNALRSALIYMTHDRRWRQNAKVKRQTSTQTST